MTTTTIEIGLATITLVGVRDVLIAERADDGNHWLEGVAIVRWVVNRDGRTYTTDVEAWVGCYADLDTDDIEWSAANEGAQAIEAVVGIRRSSGTDTRGSFARLAWPEECDDLGRAICAAIRAAR